MKNPLLAIFFAVIAAYVTVKIANHQSVVPLKPQETAFERVIRTGELRCGYNYWEPGLVFDEKHQRLWGFYFDFMQELEKESGLKIIWDHVVDWGNVQAELDNNLIDAMCAMWNTSLESRVFLFTRPFGYQTVEAIVRADDTRFDMDMTQANKPDVAIAVVDNATQDFIARSDFPLAKRIGQQMLSSNAELLMSVQSGKADMTFTNPGIFQGYDKANPRRLKRAAPGLNIRVYGNSLALGLREYALANLLNTSFTHLINTGKIDVLIDKYNRDYPGTFLKPAKTIDAK